MANTTGAGIVKEILAIVQ